MPRPEHNTWCNALEVVGVKEIKNHLQKLFKDGVLSVVIVMSNDRVLPHDVTTKDDLFYQVIVFPPCYQLSIFLFNLQSTFLTCKS